LLYSHTAGISTLGLTLLEATTRLPAQLFNAPAPANIAALVSASADDITHFYTLLSDTLSGPRIESVHHPKPYPIGIIVEIEWTNRSFGFVPDVHDPPTEYGHINIVDFPRDAPRW
jgi:hypothetical protein